MRKLLILFLTLATLQTSAQVEKAVINELLFKQGGLLYNHAEYGVSIGVIKGNKVFYIASGQRAGHLPVDNNTLFEIGSVTKTFTGLLLAEQIVTGQVNRNSYMDAYLPPHLNLAPKLRHQIKLTDLASHQSGLPNLSNDEYIKQLYEQNPVQPFSLVTPTYVYQLLAATQKLKDYGHYQYNNYAYALLGQLLQNATHRSYQQLLQSAVISPFKLTHTTLGHYKGKNTAGRFTADGQPRPLMTLNAVLPAGGLISNAADMVQYLKMQMHPPANRLGKAISLTQQRFYSDDKHVVGLGWDIFPHYIEKSGDTLGNSTLLRFSTDQQLGVVVLSDHQDSKLAEDIADAIFEELGNRR